MRAAHLDRFLKRARLLVKNVIHNQLPRKKENVKLAQMERFLLMSKQNVVRSLPFIFGGIFP